MSKKYDLIVYIGRFQPANNAHIDNILKAIELSDYQSVLIGSAFKARDIKNPFTWKERADMIGNVLQSRASSANPINSVIYSPLRDHLYSDASWLAEVQHKVKEVIRTYVKKDKARIGVIGHLKDESTYYLNMFPQWELINVPDQTGIDSTHIRDLYFGGRDVWVKGGRKEASHITNQYVIKFLDDFIEENPQEYARICKEKEHIRLYKKAWEVAPYPPMFVTSDAVVIQSGHILMVKRGAAPGEGLWALPGGFVNQFETVEDACIRELREETKLKVPAPVLKGSINAQKVFDHPLRSSRGRTITHAFFIVLKDGELPPVKGSDDAKSAKWIPLSDLEEMEDKVFEDHIHIVKWFV